MSLPYAKPRFGWRFVINLFRLAGLADDIPLKLISRSVSQNTIRAKMFQGRAHIHDTRDEALRRYSHLAGATDIITTDHAIEIHRRPDFPKIFGDLPQDNFRLTYDQLFHKLTTTTTSFGIPTAGPLSAAQIAALKDYLGAMPTVRFAAVTATTIVVQR